MAEYKLEKVDDHHFKVIKDNQHAYNLWFKSKAWSCSCPARKTCKHLAMLPPEVQVKRYPRTDIEEAYQSFITLLYPYKHTIVGSYRRGSKDSKDLDIIVLCDVKTFLSLRVQFELTFGITVIAGGDMKITGTVFGIPFDLDRIDNPNFYAAHLLYRTGPASLNIKMRQLARDMGCILNEKVTANSEEEIFKMVGMDYIPPEER